MASGFFQSAVFPSFRDEKLRHLRLYDSHDWLQEETAPSLYMDRLDLPGCDLGGDAEQHFYRIDLHHRPEWLSQRTSLSVSLCAAVSVPDHGAGCADPLQKRDQQYLFLRDARLLCDFDCRSVLPVSLSAHSPDGYFLYACNHGSVSHDPQCGPVS